MTSLPWRLTAITVRQPWAWLQAVGLMTVETRDWAPAYRGPLVIHAAAVPRERQAEFEALCELVDNSLEDLGLPPLPDRMLAGGAVAIAELVDVLVSRGSHDSRFSAADRKLADLAPGRRVWVFREVRALCPAVRVRGNQGLWTIPDSIDARVRRAFERATPAPRGGLKDVPAEHQLDLFGGC